MQWFGEDWGAPICKTLEHVATPVDDECVACGRLIVEGDAGFLMPGFVQPEFNDGGTGAGDVAVTTWHRDCLIRTIVPE